MTERQFDYKKVKEILEKSIEHVENKTNVKLEDDFFAKAKIRIIKKNRDRPMKRLLISEQDTSQENLTDESVTFHFGTSFEETTSVSLATTQGLTASIGGGLGGGGMGGSIGLNSGLEYSRSKSFGQDKSKAHTKELSADVEVKPKTLVIVKELVYEVEWAAMCELELTLGKEEKVNYKFTSGRSMKEKSHSIGVNKLLKKAKQRREAYPITVTNGPQPVVPSREPLTSQFVLQAPSSEPLTSQLAGFSDSKIDAESDLSSDGQNPSIVSDGTSDPTGEVKEEDSSILNTHDIQEHSENLPKPEIDQEIDQEASAVPPPRRPRESEADVITLQKTSDPTSEAREDDDDTSIAHSPEVDGEDNLDTRKSDQDAIQPPPIPRRRIKTVQFENEQIKPTSVSTNSQSEVESSDTTTVHAHIESMQTRGRKSEVESSDIKAAHAQIESMQTRGRSRSFDSVSDEESLIKAVRFARIQTTVGSRSSDSKLTPFASEQTREPEDYAARESLQTRGRRGRSRSFDSVSDEESLIKADDSKPTRFTSEQTREPEDYTAHFESVQTRGRTFSSSSKVMPLAFNRQVILTENSIIVKFTSDCLFSGEEHKLEIIKLSSNADRVKRIIDHQTGVSHQNENEDTLLSLK